MACSLHSLLYIDSTCSSEKETTSPRWLFGLMWTNAGGTMYVSLGCTLGLKLNLPRTSSNVGVSWHGASCYLNPLLGKTLCPPVTQGMKTCYICRWKLSSGTSAGKVKKDFFVTRVNITTAQPPSPPDKEMRCWVILVFPRCEMASLNAHEISAKGRFVCHFLNNKTQASLCFSCFVSFWICAQTSLFSIWRVP